jgi:tRNA threonylcarbamoyladenosine biosynthesis protein TsaE
MHIEVKELSELESVSKQLVEKLSNEHVWLFYGEMGSGKTTLIKEICKQLGVVDQASSPTFSIVNEYATEKGPVYHFDFYRIKSEQEALDLGYEEYFYSGRPCFVEWPELIPSLLPEEAIKIKISVETNGNRIIEVQQPTP